MNKMGEYSKWKNLGGELTSSISVTSSADRRIDVSGRGTKNELVYIYFEGNKWSKWE